MRDAPRRGARRARARHARLVERFFGHDVHHSFLLVVAAMAA
jgi:hypothetical protein